VVWAHHQYTIGMSLGTVSYFMIGTILISIPVGLIIFNFIATMWRGAMFAAVFYWLPKWTGHMYDEKLAKIFFWVNMISFNITFFPQHFLGLAGMPRRIIDYNVIFAEFNFLSSVAGLIYGFSHLLFLYIIIKAIRGGQQAKNKVWEGATGLEWELPSPPPFHSWETAPKIK